MNQIHHTYTSHIYIHTYTFNIDTMIVPDMSGRRFTVSKQLYFITLANTLCFSTASLHFLPPRTTRDIVGCVNTACVCSLSTFLIKMKVVLKHNNSNKLNMSKRFDSGHRWAGPH